MKLIFKCDRLIIIKNATKCGNFSTKCGGVPQNVTCFPQNVVTFPQNEVSKQIQIQIITNKQINR